MEFHNVKLLPRGLPEIMAQLVPYDIYPDTKVIVYPRKQRRGLQGQAGCDGESYLIKLYPTVITLYHSTHEGTISFSLWLGFLRVALHEIGHHATRLLWQDLPENYSHYSAAHFYIEKLADNWMDQALARILRVDPRLGQPPGFITGYPGVEAHRWRKSLPVVHHRRLADFRGFRCGGQVTLGVVASHAKVHLLGSGIWDLEPESRARLERIVKNQVHRAASSLGIRRYAFSTNGRRYLMFNAGEAEAVYEWLVDNRSVLIDAYRLLKLQQEAPKHWAWQLTDGDWDLLGIDTPQEVPPEQMRLPF